MTDSERIDAEIGKFPKFFQLRAFPRQNFTINRSASYVSRGEVTLYVFTEDGKAFSKGTPDELARQIQWVRTGERVRGGSTDGRVAW